MEFPPELTSADLSHTSTAKRLDGLVAETVLGWTKPTRPYQSWDKRPDVPGVMLCRQNELPAFSSEIGAAWEVVEKLRKRYHVDISVGHRAARVRVFLGEPYELLPGAVRDLANVEARTAPMAICLAGLEAVEQAARVRVSRHSGSNVAARSESSSR